MPHKYLLKEFEELARSAANPETLMQRVSQRIHMHIPRYNWVGFYLVDSNDPSVLMLGPHTGSFTPKAKISWNEGLCGSAAASRRVIVADNVGRTALHSGFRSGEIADIRAHHGGQQARSCL